MDLTDQIKTRRSAIKSMFTTIVVASNGMFGIANAYPRTPINEEWVKKNGSIKKYPDKEQMTQDQQQLFSGITVHDGFVFIAGKGEHGEADIKVHAKKVLDKIEEELFAACSSMEKLFVLTSISIISGITME